MPLNSIIFCPLYPQDNTISATGGSYPDKHIYNKVYLYSSHNVVVRENSFTDAAAFKAAMSGVYLYYILTAPTEVSFDKPSTLIYKESASGTEEIVVSNEETAAHIDADIMYGSISIGDLLNNLYSLLL